MLREYRLTNFKAFGETVTIPIRPLTLIFGANSSGKSSIFQSLLLLKQTLEEAKSPNTALLPKGSLVDLGTYCDFVHRHDTDRDFDFRVRFDLESGSNIGTREMGLASPREQAIEILNDAGVMNAGLTFRFSYDEEKPATVSFPCVDLTLGDEPQPLISDIGCNVTINFESEFWRQWWHNIKERFNGILKLAYNAELGGEECKVGELKGVLQNSSLEDVINDLKEMKGSELEEILNAFYEEIKVWTRKPWNHGNWREEVINDFGEEMRDVEGILNALKEETKGSQWEELIDEINDVRAGKRLQYIRNALKEDARKISQLEELINEINDVRLTKGVEEILSILKEETMGASQLEDDIQLEDTIDTITELKHDFSHVKYKNFLPDRVNLFARHPKRKRSIFNTQLYIMTNYPTEDGNTADYGDGYSRDFREELNLSIREIITRLCSPFPQFLESLVYLGPLRSYPERHYEFSGDTTEYVGQSGEYLPSILFQRPELVKQINKDLERLKVKYQLKVSKLQYEEGSSPSNVFSLRLVDTETKTDASLRDVGFGISQVLPIVAQSCLSEKKTLLIEQPEIHLHPAHQAELGDIFIRSALREEQEQRNTILLETHSENLILRILRRIRETNDNELPEGFPPIRPEDVAILYVQPGEKGVQVIEIPVTEDGEFARPWPEGFFDERVEELF